MRIGARIVVFMALWASCAPIKASADEFCDGFERGYATGYKQASGSSLDPLPVICPLKPLKKFNDPPSDFEFGYLLGLAHGQAAGR